MSGCNPVPSAPLQLCPQLCAWRLPEENRSRAHGDTRQTPPCAPPMQPGGFPAVFCSRPRMRCSSGGPAGLQPGDTNPRGPWGWAAQFDVLATLFVLPSSEKSSCQHTMSPVQGSGRISQCWGCHHTGTAQQELWLRPAWRVVRERWHSTNPGEF